MFSITDNERLRDAYALLMFMQSDIPASAEKRAAVKNLAATVKMEIRAYNNRPAPDVHIICADYDGRLELVQLPDKLDEALHLDVVGLCHDELDEHGNAFLDADGHDGNADQQGNVQQASRKLIHIRLLLSFSEPDSSGCSSAYHLRWRQR